MPFGFIELHELLLKWPQIIPPDGECENGLFKRILYILRMPEGLVTYKKDFQALIRNALGIQYAHNHVASLTVPSNNEWPSAEDWGAFNISATLNGQSLKLEIDRWSPQWLSENGTDILHDIFQGDNCRNLRTVDGDPAMQNATGLNSYSSNGQRNAIRSLLLAPEGSTLVVNMPTGSGKSLVGYMPALLDTTEGNMTIFIVPTIALAIDQARQFKEIFEKKGRRLQNISLCWHSGLNQDERAIIKDNIRSGRQLILFCSPESACTSLKPALYKAAENHYIRYFVVDEAHIVSQWGDYFRPAFQSLAGLRRGLLSKCNERPFTTALMTATLTEETLNTLETLFDSPKGVQTVSAVYLRPEPQYWIKKAQDFEEKKRFIIESIYNAPRPMILYVTTRSDADDWLKIIKQEGFKRVALFHGSTPTNSREVIIDEWQKDKLDIIVATSAFGLGIDKSDVRTVIHACVPESLDRFYQEVGRGGRDGSPSLSLVVYTDDDYQVGKDMSRRMIITVERARERWTALMNNRRVIDETLIALDLNTVPPNLQQESDENKKWNLRTIHLLARAGVLKLHDMMPERDNNEILEQPLNENEMFFDRVIVEIINPGHQNDNVWKKIINAARKQSKKSSTNNFNLLRKILNNDISVEDALAKLYRIKRLQVYPAKNCGSCPMCRQNEIQLCFTEPMTFPIKTTKEITLEIWKNRFPAIQALNPIYVSYQPERFDLQRLFANLSEHLIRQMGLCEILFTDNDRLRQYNQHIIQNMRWIKEEFFMTGILSDIESGDSGMSLPCLTLLYPWGDEPLPDYLMVSMAGRPLHIIMFPESVPDRENRYRRFIDTEMNHIGLDDFMMRIPQWEY